MAAMKMENSLGDLNVRLKYKKGESEDWTKIEDKALRKKMQDRLAKRKSRATDAVTRNKHARTEKRVETRNDASNGSQGDNSPTRPVFELPKVFGATHVPPGHHVVEQQIANFFTTPGLAEHRFIRLTQYSLMRAFVQNANLLALDPSTFADDGSLSPWTISNPYPVVIPHDLAPTPTQLCTPHHPYLDIFASKNLRDNILLASMDDAMEDRFCYEIHHIGAFTVWGSQPWCAQGMASLSSSCPQLTLRLEAWEATQAFATAWSWLLDEETIRSSNFWRGERGEPPLLLPVYGDSMSRNMILH